jgi:hypothetical protein
MLIFFSCYTSASMVDSFTVISSLEEDILYMYNFCF